MQVYGPDGFHRNSSTLPYWNESRHRPHINEWVWLCYNEALFTKTDVDRIWLSLQKLAQKYISKLFFNTEKKSCPWCLLSSPRSNLRTISVDLCGHVHVFIYRGGPPFARSTKLFSWPLDRSLTSPFVYKKHKYPKAGATALPLVTRAAFSQFLHH